MKRRRVIPNLVEERSDMTRLEDLRSTSVPSVSPFLYFDTMSDTVLTWDLCNVSHFLRSVFPDVGYTRILR